MPKIKEVFRRHEREYMGLFGELMPSWHRKALRSVVACRTPAMGFHLRGCADCGAQEVVHNSCRSRACPDCHGGQVVEWLAARSSELLPVRHFHLVFTVPSKLRGPMRRHQKALLGALMRAAAETILTLAADPRHLGGIPAIMVVLHTSGRDLTWHPHVHCLVPAGAVDGSGAWVEPPNSTFLFPVKALAGIFRQRLAKLARDAAPGVELPWKVFSSKEKWVAYSKACLAGPGEVLEYLGRYLSRPPIGDKRILKATKDEVVFTFKDTATGKARTRNVAPIEFIRRCLQHVPPPGLHRIRYFGLWSPAKRADLHRARLLLATLHPKEAAAVGEAAEKAVKARGDLAAKRASCPRCGSKRLTILARIKPAGYDSS
jgi:Zn finger protein HypA/HybF involved in hydrogenase expression